MPETMPTTCDLRERPPRSRVTFTARKVSEKREKGWAMTWVADLAAPPALLALIGHDHGPVGIRAPRNVRQNPEAFDAEHALDLLRGAEDPVELFAGKGGSDTQHRPTRRAISATRVAFGCTGTQGVDAGDMTRASVLGKSDALVRLRLLA